MNAPSMSFVVPGEPMPKERAEPTIRKRGKKLHVAFRPGTRTADYEGRVRLVARAARPHGWPLRCRYRVDLVIYRSEKGDKDNYEKAVLDGVNPRRAKYVGEGDRKRLVEPHVPGVLWLDDGRVYEGEQRIVDVPPREARIEVSVTAIAVPCENKRCGHRQTFFPDEIGRCEECQSKASARARRAS